MVTVDVVADVAVAAVAERLRCAYEGCGGTNSRKLTIGTGEGMAARHQARPSRKGRQDQEHGGDVRSQAGLGKEFVLTADSYLHSLPIKEYQIVDFFLPTLKDEVMKVRKNNHRKKANGRLRAVY